MAVPKAQSMYSLWFSPPSEIAETLRDIIKNESIRNNTYPFEPHITLIGSIWEMPKWQIMALVKQLCDETEPFKIKLTKLCEKNEEYQCVFGLAEVTPQITTINQIARRLFERFDDPPYMPHLSFIYGKPDHMTLDKRQNALVRIKHELDKQFDPKKVNKSIPILFNNNNNNESDKKHDTSDNENESEIIINNNDNNSISGINSSNNMHDKSETKTDKRDEIDFSINNIEFLVDRVEIWETPVGIGKCMEWDLFESYQMTGLKKHKFGQMNNNNFGTYLGNHEDTITTTAASSSASSSENDDGNNKTKLSENDEKLKEIEKEHMFDETIDIYNNELKMKHRKSNSVSLLTKMLNENHDLLLANDDEEDEYKGDEMDTQVDSHGSQYSRRKLNNDISRKDNNDDNNNNNNSKNEHVTLDTVNENETAFDEKPESNSKEKGGKEDNGENELEFEWDTESDDEATKLLMEQAALSTDDENENNDNNMNENENESENKDENVVNADDDDDNDENLVAMDNGIDENNNINGAILDDLMDGSDLENDFNDDIDNNEDAYNNNNNQKMQPLQQQHQQQHQQQQHQEDDLDSESMNMVD